MGTLGCATTEDTQAMPLDETRAVARLPLLDIEIHHRKVPEGGEETLSVTLRGRPDLDAATALLDPFRLVAAWAAFNPWLLMLRQAQAAHNRLSGPGERTRP